MKEIVIKRKGYKCLENYEDNEVNIRLYEDENGYEVEHINLQEDIFTYYIYEKAWGEALDRYNYLVTSHIMRKDYTNIGEAESIHGPK